MRGSNRVLSPDSPRAKVEAQVMRLKEYIISAIADKTGVECPPQMSLDQLVRKAAGVGINLHIWSTPKESLKAPVQPSTLPSKPLASGVVVIQLTRSRFREERFDLIKDGEGLGGHGKDKDHYLNQWFIGQGGRAGVYIGFMTIDQALADFRADVTYKIRDHIGIEK